MLRVWALAVVTAIGCLIVYLGVGFFGDDALKFSSVVVGAGAAAAYLPGGVALSRAIYLLVGTLAGALGFAAGAMAFPDNNRGVFFGALVPILLSAIIAMWSRKQEVFITLMLGAGAFGASYTTAFFTDPQSLNYTLPIALGQVIVTLGIGYLLAAIVKTFLPSKPKEAKKDEAATAPVDDAPAASAEASEAPSDNESELSVLRK